MNKFKYVKFFNKKMNLLCGECHGPINDKGLEIMDYIVFILSVYFYLDY